jgi:hypothetical protein
MANLSVWLYDWREGQGPIFMVLHEWEHGEMRGLSFDAGMLWFHVDDRSADEIIEAVRVQLDDSDALAKAVANGSLRRVGELPALCEHRWMHNRSSNSQADRVA